ncbi:unnamed protein product [Urochloa decumbens]|uniref:F-box domain-containing protein n=1 Tax=Urochloa decumbens TaxID=240449 RepID=A0ABC9AQF0_9POAL
METEAVYPDWSGLPEELILMVMQALGIPDLLRAGAVCPSWRAAGADLRRARFPITDPSPCLLYSAAAAADDPDTATVYNPSTGAAFKVRLPAPPFRSRHVVGSGHGWVITADEESNLQVVNPLTGAQVDLPPAATIHNVRPSYDDQGRPIYNLFGDHASPVSRRELRTLYYYRVYLSCSPSAGTACFVLLVHREEGQISYARVGDGRWTHIRTASVLPPGCGYYSAAYNDKDGLFYLLTCDHCIYTLDLSAAPPAVSAAATIRKISKGVKGMFDPIAEATRYAQWGDLVLTPWGDILLVWRDKECRELDSPVHVPAGFEHEVTRPFHETYTQDILLYKVGVNGRKKLVEIGGTDLRGHALFLGFNSSMCLSTKDFPLLKPNCAYLTDDSWESISLNMFGCRDVGIWNFETQTLEEMKPVDAWLNWPQPIWITPSLLS